MNTNKFIIITLLTLVTLNLARVVCLKYCLYTPWYQMILNDNLHHYQLGIILIVVSLMFLRNKEKLRDFIVAVAVGLVIDESMYVLYAFGYKSFSHNQLNGTIFEFVIFSLYAFWVIRISGKSSISNLDTK